MVSPGPLEGWGLESSEGSLSHVALDAGGRLRPLGCWLETPQMAVVATPFISYVVLTSWGLAAPGVAVPPRQGQAVLETPAI